MATLPSALSRLQPPSTVTRVDLGKQVASVTHLHHPAARLTTPRTARLFTLPKEPEDARITGGTRSLDRRLLALNLSGPRLVVKPV
jgi:hypothetical protein